MLAEVIRVGEARTQAPPPARTAEARFKPGIPKCRRKERHYARNIGSSPDVLLAEQEGVGGPVGDAQEVQLAAPVQQDRVAGRVGAVRPVGGDDGPGGLVE